MHVQLVGGGAAACQVYPPKLCTAILKGFRTQLLKDGKAYQNEIGSVCCEEPVVHATSTWTRGMHPMNTMEPKECNSMMTLVRRH